MGSMMANVVTKFHNAILGLGVCLNVCWCVKVTFRILSFGKGGIPKFGVDVEGVYST